MTTINVKLSIGYPTACRHDEIEIPDDELEGLSPDEREMKINEYVRDWAHEYINWSWTE